MTTPTVEQIVRYAKQRVAALTHGRDNPQPILNEDARSHSSEYLLLLMIRHIEYIAANKSNVVIERRTDSLLRFFAWLKGRRLIKDGMANGLLVSQWFFYLENSRDEEEWIRFYTQQHTSAFFRWLSDSGFITNRPHLAVRRMKRKPAKPMMMITLEEYEKLKEATKGTYWHYACIAAWHCGTSIGDTALMRREDIFWEEKMIRVVRRKTKHYANAGLTQEIPIAPGTEWYAMLEEVLSQPPSNEWPNTDSPPNHYLCPGLAAEFINSKATGSRPGALWDYYAKKVGLQKGKTFHSFRAAFITNAAQAGVPIPVLMRMTGHTDPSTLIRYVRPETKDLRESYQKLMIQRGDA